MHYSITQNSTMTKGQMPSSLFSKERTVTQHLARRLENESHPYQPAHRAGHSAEGAIATLACLGEKLLDKRRMLEFFLYVFKSAFNITHPGILPPKI